MKGNPSSSSLPGDVSTSTIWHRRLLPFAIRHPPFAIRHSQFVILACFILLALAYGLVVPPFENQDEAEHFGMIRYIAEMGQLPVHGIPEAEVYHYRQEASQPPLYHLLSAGLMRLSGLRADDALDFWRFNSWVICGPGGAGLYDNRAIFYHDPNRESFPWHGTMLTLHVLRVWSTLLQVVTVTGTYGLARLAFPRHRAAGLVAMAIVAFNPQFLLVASGINNDNLVTPLVTVGLYLLLRIWQDGLSVWRTVALGVLTGLAGLAKLSGWLLLPLSATVILIRAYRPRARKTPFAIRHLSYVIFPALAVSGWWFWRNWRLYGDPTALQPMLELVGTRDGSVIQPLLDTGWMFRSFWGRIPCSLYPPAFYVFYAILTMLALGGLAWAWRRLTSAERTAGVILGGWFVLIVVSWMRWDTITAAPAGRLLFPALPSVALLMALGINHCASLIRHSSFFRHSSFLISNFLLLLALWTVARILPGFFAPPPRYPDAGAGLGELSRAVRPGHALDATLGDTVRVLGYDVALDNQPAVSLAEPRPMLDATLYWQTLASMVEDYVMALQLVSAVPGDTTLRWNYNSWPARGNYPTSAWQPGEVIVDHYNFRLPEANFPTQAWHLQVILYEQETGQRLPVQVSGQPAGDALWLTTLRVAGEAPDCPARAALDSPPLFGDAVALTHAEVVPGEDSLDVLLCWDSRRSLPEDYTVFVHLYDSQGTLVGTGDGPPMGGAFPTHLWQPGDAVRDLHRLPRPPALDVAQARITVGLYKAPEGERLAVTIDGDAQPDGALEIWPNKP